MTTFAHSKPADTTASVSSEQVLRSTESPPAVAVVMDFVGATLPQLDGLLDSLRFNPGGPGVPGSLFQWSRSTGDGVRVTEVWQSRRHFERFLREVIVPRLSEAALPQPQVTTYDVHSYFTQGPALDSKIQPDQHSNGTQG
jgi:hypothetical protein